MEQYSLLYVLFMFQIVATIHFFSLQIKVSFKNASFIEPPVLWMKQSGFAFTGRGLLKVLGSTFLPRHSGKLPMSAVFNLDFYDYFSSTR